MIGKTAYELDRIARDAGLIAMGSDPISGKGAYIDPATGAQRLLIHPAQGHLHLNDRNGRRLDQNGRFVAPEEPQAHLPLRV